MKFLTQPLFDACLSTGLPLVVSTGLSSAIEIDQLCAKFINQKTPNYHTVLHCVTSYPTKPQDYSLIELSQLSNKYPSLNIGLSDHSGLIYPSLYALSHGFSMVEFHVTYDRNMYGPDFKSSNLF